MWAHGSRVRNLFTQNLVCTLLILPEADWFESEWSGARVLGRVASDMRLPVLAFSEAVKAIPQVN